MVQEIRLKDSKSFISYSFSKIMVKFFRMVVYFFSKKHIFKQQQLKKNTEKKVSDSVVTFQKHPRQPLNAKIRGKFKLFRQFLHQEHCCKVEKVFFCTLLLPFYFRYEFCYAIFGQLNDCHYSCLFNLSFCAWYLSTNSLASLILSG